MRLGSALAPGAQPSAPPWPAALPIAWSNEDVRVPLPPWIGLAGGLSRPRSTSRPSGRAWGQTPGSGGPVVCDFDDLPAGLVSGVPSRGGLFPDGAEVVDAAGTWAGAGDGVAIDFVKLLVNPHGVAQTGSIHGTVIDASSQTGLEGVRVAAGGMAETTTGADGQYTLANIPAGLVLMTLAKHGYFPASRLVGLVAGQTTEAAFALERQPLPEIRIAEYAVRGEDMVVVWTGGPGQLQRCDDLSTGVWIPVGPAGVASAADKVGAGPAFYRVLAR